MPVSLHTFPSRDREFASYAQEAFDALEAPSVAALQRAVRARYPAALVTAQEELARHGEGPEVWYVFRTAAVGSAAVPATPDRAGDEPPATDAWAILDDDRRFLEVSPRLATIAEIPVRRMLGHLVEDFSNPADPTIRDDIERLWREFQSSRSLTSTLRFNYADGRPRELAYRLEADADGAGRHRLSVWVLSDG